MRHISVAIAGLAVAVAACGSSDASFEQTVPTTAPEELEVVDPTPPSTISPDEVPAEFVAELIADAATRTGHGEDELSVVIAESVLWSDGSLGCPEPGVMYTQAMVDGYRVLISTPSGDIDYRTGGTDFYVVCEQ